MLNNTTPALILLMWVLYNKQERELTEMLLKACNTEKGSVSFHVEVYYSRKEISLTVEYFNKITKDRTTEAFSCDDFAIAEEHYNEWCKLAEQD